MTVCCSRAMNSIYIAGSCLRHWIRITVLHWYLFSAFDMNYVLRVDSRFKSKFFSLLTADSHSINIALILIDLVKVPGTTSRIEKSMLK